MTKIKKLALLLAICMVGTVGLVGRGNDGGSSSKNESSASQTADDSAADSKDGDSSASVVGTWTVTALEGTDGKAVSIDDYTTANGVDPETLKCTYTFAEDGTFSGEMSGVTVSGNYTFEGTDLVMTVGEQQLTTHMTLTMICLNTQTRTQAFQAIVKDSSNRNLIPIS